MTSNIPASLSITAYVHCGKCLKEIPDGVSPRDWAELEVGFTKQGLQIWCKRHEVNVVHIDFEGQSHPANLNPEEIATTTCPQCGGDVDEDEICYGGCDREEEETNG